MKILHINSYFKTNALHGELIYALSRFGLDQSVYLPVAKADVEKERFRLRDGCSAKIYEIGVFWGFSRFVWPLKIYQVWKGFLSVLRDVRPDLIHAHTVISNGLIALFAKKVFGFSYVVTIRNTDIDFFFRRIPFFVQIGRKVLQHSERIVVLSPVYVKYKLPAYIQRVEFPEIYEKIEVVPNGIAEEWFADPPKGRKAPCGALLFLGRIDDNKNLILVIEAIEYLRSKGVELKLNVVGDGVGLSSLRERARELDVDFYGRLDDVDSIKAVMSRSDILVVPSKRETFGLVYVEAMSQGLPVIYTRGQGFDGFFEEGEIGYAVSSDDSIGVGESIRLIYRDYERISDNAIRAAMSYRWPDLARSLLGVYSRSVREELIAPVDRGSLSA